MTKLARAVCTAAFILGTIPLAILVDEPAALAQQMPADRPAKPDSPDCVPVGVKTDPDGTVWAVEKCHGVNF